MYLLLALFLIFFEAVPEAIRDKGNKALSGRLEFIYRALITIMLFQWFMGTSMPIHTDSFELLRLLIAYVLVRYAIFDALYNLTIGMPLFYIGQTKDIDKCLGWFFRVTKFPKTAFLGFTKFISLFWGISWLLISNPN